MESVALKRVVEKMELENLTPDIEIRGIRVTQSDVNLSLIHI